MSEQVGTHSVPIGGGDDRERPPELETPRSAAAPFEPVGAIPQMDQKRGRGWRPWAIIGVAIAVPAAVAAVLVTTLGGSDAPAAQQAAQTPAPTPVVEQTAATVQPPAAAVRTATPVRTAPTAPDRATTAATDSTASAVPTVSRADAAAAAAAESAVAGEAAAELATPQERLYAWADTTQVTVVEGDSLWGLALEYGTTVEAISMLNGITDPAELSIGAVLSIPAGFAESLAPVEEVVVEESAGSSEAAASMATRFETTPPAETPLADWPNVVEWTIQPGDSLSALATTFETTPEAIMTLNSIADANLVYAGTTIRIPVGYAGGSEAAAAAETTGASEETTSEPETTTQQAVTTGESANEPQTTTTQQAATANAADELQEAAAPANENAGGDYLEEESGAGGSSATGDSLEEETPASGSGSDDGDYLEQ